VYEADKLSLIKDKFPLWVYILILIRQNLLKILAMVKLKDIFTALYHYSIRVRATLMKRKKCSRSRVVKTNSSCFQFVENDSDTKKD
jgi:hypothetical protein